MEQNIDSIDIKQFLRNPPRNSKYDDKKQRGSSVIKWLSLLLCIILGVVLLIPMPKSNKKDTALKTASVEKENTPKRIEKTEVVPKRVDVIKPRKKAQKTKIRIKHQRNSLPKRSPREIEVKRSYKPKPKTVIQEKPKAIKASKESTTLLVPLE